MSLHNIMWQRSIKISLNTPKYEHQGSRRLQKCDFYDSATTRKYIFSVKFFYNILNIYYTYYIIIVILQVSN